MFEGNADTAVILGAGFANCADLPLQDDISSELLASDFDSRLDQVITDAITEFLVKSFGWIESDPLPELEDIFTVIDLSANSGHNLGRKFKPKRLRALRRMLIFRVFSILDRRFKQSEAILELLGQGIGQGDERTTHFLTLNWDIVLERHLEYINDDIPVSYCVQGYPWNIDSVERYSRPSPREAVAVAKPHGSSNWVYCDSCRTVFFDRYRKLSLAIKAGLVKADFRLFDESMTDSEFDDALGIEPTRRSCPRCRSVVGPHIATFSYQKSFRTHAFSSAWLAAEEILTRAERWTFIGYSLRASDFEFKHLLKLSEQKFAISGQSRKRINAVVLDDPDAEARFVKFFGSDRVTVHQDGLEGYLAEGLL